MRSQQQQGEDGNGNGNSIARESSQQWFGAAGRRDPRFLRQVDIGVGVWHWDSGLIAQKWSSATVILTDFLVTQALLRENIAANGLGHRCTAAELNFGDVVTVLLKALADKGDVTSSLASTRCTNFDVIAALDCRFSVGTKFEWEPFVTTIASAAAVASSPDQSDGKRAPPTQVLISLQERYGPRVERLEPFLIALSDLAGVKRV